MDTVINKQLILDLKPQTLRVNRADLIIGEHNKELVTFLYNNFINHSHKILFIYGNKAVGKSYIAQLYLQEQNGKKIDFSDIDDILKIEHLLSKYNCLLLEDINNLTKEQQVNLFNLYNLVNASSSQLIITALNNPNNLDIQLNDLKSRLLNTMIFKIDEPQDLELKQLLLKIFLDQQLSVEMSVIDYILNRVERKAEKLQIIVNQIYNLAASSKKPISVHLVKQILG
ncbi:DnaA ATPase domain-containing protein [Rickettsiales bacterium LUAb2]